MILFNSIQLCKKPRADETIDCAAAKRGCGLRAFDCNTKIGWNIYPPATTKAFLKMIFLFLRWDFLVPQRVITNGVVGWVMSVLSWDPDHIRAHHSKPSQADWQQEWSYSKRSPDKSDNSSHVNICTLMKHSDSFLGLNSMKWYKRFFSKPACWQPSDPWWVLWSGELVEERPVECKDQRSQIILPDDKCTGNRTMWTVRVSGWCGWRLFFLLFLDVFSLPWQHFLARIHHSPGTSGTMCVYMQVFTCMFQGFWHRSCLGYSR